LTVNISAAFKKGVSGYSVVVPLVGSEWADKYFYLSPESSGTEGRWKTYPYQIGIINWMTSDDIEEINFMKSRRVGYTKCLLAAAASLIVQKNRNVAIWQPTDGDAKDFVVDEVDTMLRDVPVLGEKLKCQVGKKSKYNTLDKKVFLGATLDIKGGKSARNYRRMTKDVGIYDELSGFDNDIDGEGSAVELGDGRLDQAPFPKSIRGSTPKIKGICQIEAAVEKADMVFYRYVRCIHCGELQRLEFSQLHWTDNDESTTHYVCKHNGCVLHYRDYPEMDVNGRWQTVDGFYYSDDLDKFFNPLDEETEKPKRIAARIWAAYSYLRPWSYIVYKWITASKEAKTGKITALKSVINTLLGETFEETGETVNSTALGRRGEDYLVNNTIPNEVLIVTAGADVQGGANPRIEVEFLGHGLEGETWSLGYQVVKGDAISQAVWDNLDEELKKTFTRDDGVSLGVSCAFIDSGYLASEVYKFTGPRRKRNIYATKGVNTGQLCNKGSWQGDLKKKNRAILRTINVDDAKTIIFKRLRIEEPGPGYCHFPGHYSDQHYKQLTNETKRKKRKNGVVVGFEWVKKGPNEQLDVRSYNLGAFEFLNPSLAKIKLRLERQAEQHKQVPEVKLDQTFMQESLAKRKKKIKGRQNVGNWVNGWK
jgi:phage terminase large subunit GpA-like protein